MVFKRKRSKFLSFSEPSHSLTNLTQYEWLVSGGIPSKDEVEVQNHALDMSHQYLKGLEEINNDEEYLIQIIVGFRVELGGNGDTEVDLSLEEQLNHIPYYRDNFSTFPHSNFIGGDGSNPILISAKIEDEKKDKKKTFLWRVIVWTKKESYFLQLWASSKPKLLKRLKIVGTEVLGEIEFTEVKDEKITEELVHIEDRLLIKAYKFGVVYCKQGQKDENEMFSNESPSDCFSEFMESIAEKITLKGFEQYKGGLNTIDDSTGTHSYFTVFKGFEIMFHVSTCLPFSESNPQQVERKRQIGNDVVVIIFQDGPNGGFSLNTITSKFNHVYAVVQPEIPDGTGPDTKYHLGFASKDGVKIHGPVLPPKPFLFPKGEDFREFLLTKLINAERAAYYAPGFAQSRTRRLWLKEFLDKYGPTPNPK